ncbi:hypothetical protein [Tengunoibacter tsumagoiensis]|uniref:PE domain-containing protein n=1 Tax=Tengunoibacter tsumagoiensis TaxID=2014871 RepID=A0A402A608_9CHLR|nr:hypothetical protein [Tengunoibacter tsumagoiensis]GCE14584.1 hypothetical protein KTT_44430 [Tengunoibacter tsumagoiensis]
MSEITSYPFDDMSTTSKSLTTFLDEQWQQHTALFLNNSDSHTTLLQAIANVIPGMGGKASELASALENYHNQYASHYQALHDLASMIDTAAQSMGLEDKLIANGFEGNQS